MHTHTPVTGHRTKELLARTQGSAHVHVCSCTYPLLLLRQPHAAIGALLSHNQLLELLDTLVLFLSNDLEHRRLKVPNNVILFAIILLHGVSPCSGEVKGNYVGRGGGVWRVGCI